MSLPDTASPPAPAQPPAGSAVWDGVAPIAIGLLLLAVASTLATANVSLPVGRAVPRRVHDAIAADPTSVPGVLAVPTLLTMQLGPGQTMVAAKVDFPDRISGAEIEAAADEAERRLRERYPGIRHVFLDPTRVAGARTRPGGGAGR